MDPTQPILKRLPPIHLGKNVKVLSNLLKENPEAKDALHKKHPLPFDIVKPHDTNQSNGDDDNNNKNDNERPFIACRYNRIGEKHRSPWTNRLYPRDSKPTVNDDDNALLSMNDRIRTLESTFNEVWDSYKNLYYGSTAVSSVYLQDTSDKYNNKTGSFEGVFCIQKGCTETASAADGSWGCIHYVHVDEPTDKGTCSYTVDSVVLAVVVADSSSQGDDDDDDDGDNNDSKQQPEQEQQQQQRQTSVSTSATLSKETTKTCKLVAGTSLSANHITNIGTMIESNEIDIRANLERIYMPKTQEMVSDLLPSRRGSANAKDDEAKMMKEMIMGPDILKNTKLQLQ